MRPATILAVVAASILLPIQAGAQAGTARPDTLAWAGAAGIYIWTGGTVVSRAHPVDGVVAHRVERRRPGAPSWNRVGEVEAVSSAEDFFSRLDPLLRRLVPAALGQRSESETWNYIVRFPRADSLSRIIGNESVRLALGLYALDTEVRAGETWEYRSSDLDAAGSVRRAVLVAPVAYPARVTFAPVSVVRVESTDSSAVIWWRIGQRGHPVRSLEIWRRQGRQGAFARVDSVLTFLQHGDTVFARHEASGLARSQSYQFYAVPRDIFLNRGVSQDTATAYTVRDVPPGLPDSLRARSVDTAGVELTWRLADSRLVRAIKVFRSPAQDTGWRQIAELPPTARRFLDQRTPEMEMIYYRLAVVGPYNSESPPTASVFGYFRNASPLAAPYGLTAQAGPNGRGVRLTWQPGDRVLQGYYIYRTWQAVDSIVADTSLTQVSPLIPPQDTTWIDTVSAHGPGREYGYVIQAVSPSNIRSGFSPPVFFAPADSIGIPPPTGLRGNLDGPTVRLFWNDMTDVEFGVAGYNVYRRSVGSADSGLTRLSTVAVPAPRNTWTDSSAVQGQTYEYVVRSVDRSRVESAPSAPVRILVPLGRPPAPADLRALVLSDGIGLSWGEISGLQGQVRIYRYQRGGSPARLAEVPATGSAYIDRTAQPGRRYHYYLRLVVDGVEGASSLEASAER